MLHLTQLLLVVNVKDWSLSPVLREAIWLAEVLNEPSTQSVWILSEYDSGIYVKRVKGERDCRSVDRASEN